MPNKLKTKVKIEINFSGHDLEIFSNTSRFEGFNLCACMTSAHSQVASAFVSKAFDTIENLVCFDSANRFNQQSLDTRALQSVGWHVFRWPGPPRAFCHALVLNIVKNITELKLKAVLRLLQV